VLSGLFVVQTPANNNSSLHPVFLLIQALVPVTEDMQRNQVTSTTSAPGSPQEPIEVRTENLFQRTEVLAGTRHNKQMAIGGRCYFWTVSILI